MDLHDETLITDNGKVVKHHTRRILFVGFCVAMMIFLVVLGVLAIIHARGDLWGKLILLRREFLKLSK